MTTQGFQALQQSGSLNDRILANRRPMAGSYERPECARKLSCLLLGHGSAPDFRTSANCEQGSVCLMAKERTQLTSLIVTGSGLSEPACRVGPPDGLIHQPV